MQNLSPKLFVSIFLITLLFSVSSFADSVGKTAMQNSDKDVQQKIRTNLSSLLPGLLPDSITKTAVPGLYEVVFGPRIVYVTEDARFLVQGSIIDMETRENLTEPRLNEVKVQAVENIGTESMLVYSPPKDIPIKHVVTVFTDIDCGYCRKLHGEMADYNGKGIEIRYLFYPRAGVGSESYKKAVKVWCSKDRHEAMDISKAGNPVDARTDCDNPVDEHMKLGGLVGVSGTPALVLDDGKVVPGYVPADRLIKVLDARKATN